MHSFRLLFTVSLLVVPLLHTYFFYDLSHAERVETTNPPQFLSLTWHFGEQSCQRDRPVLPEIMLHYTNSLIICDLFSSLELANQNEVCRCAHARAFIGIRVISHMGNSNAEDF